MKQILYIPYLNNVKIYSSHRTWEINEIINTDFSEVLNQDDIETAAEIFSKTFVSVVDNHAPVKIFQSRKQKTENNPLWY